MASGPITSWQVDWETMETVRDFIFLGSKITADGDCSHEVQRHFLFGRKVKTNLDSVLTVMYGYERKTMKKAECQRIDAFELSCWGRLLRVPWTGRRSNQLVLKEINPVYSLEGLMLNFKLQHFGHLMQKANSLEKILMLGKTEEDDRG